MAAPKGNQFWKLRAKHGRDKLFESPELLWEAACEYFEWCESNPLIETQAKSVSIPMGGGTEIQLVQLPVMRAMTLSQLCLYLGCNDAYFRTFKAQMTEKDKDFNTVINQIEQTIYNQKFQGAAGNLLNANIISRELGLIDKQDIDIGGVKSIIIEPASKAKN